MIQSLAPLGGGAAAVLFRPPNQNPAKLLYPDSPLLAGTAERPPSQKSGMDL